MSRRKKKLFLSSLCVYCSKEFFSYPSQKRKYCSPSCRSFSTQSVDRNPLIGRKLSLIHRTKLSVAHIGVQAKEKHPRWKGGVYNSLRQEDMANHKYKAWRMSVMSRDEFSCVGCDSNKRLEAHHIKLYATHIELRYDVDNGITVCYDCHKAIHRKAA